jgi:hypothetical protein
MYPILPSELLIEERNCRQCSTPFPITDKDMEFYSKVSPVFPKPSPLPPSKEGGSRIPLSEGDTGGVREEWDKIRYLIPPPTLCPDCRQQRRLAFRNERKLYKRKCDATGNEMLSMFPPTSPFIIYHPEKWYEYDCILRDSPKYDFQSNFFSQFWSLLQKTPLLWLSVAYNENCDYTNQCGNSKNCYYSFDVGMSKDSLYCNFIDDSSNLVDCSSSHESHSCYSCVDILWCMESYYLLRCSDCSFSTRLIDCTGCQYCSECINLTNAKYCYRNRQYSKEEWEAREYDTSWDEMSWEDFLQRAPRKNLILLSSPESFWDHIAFSRNALSCFEVKDGENIKYIDRSRILKDSMDIRWFWNNLQMSYDSLAVGINAYNILFSQHCWSNVSNLMYCMYCTDGTKNCFGCIGLRNASYCILNRQYTKEEYESLVPRIIEHMMKTPLIEGGSHGVTGGSTFEWWEFFPASLSPFGYNETVANEYYPLTREEVVALSLRGTKQSSMSLISGTPGSPRSARDDETGESFLHWPTFNWSDYESPFPTVEKIIPANKLPDTIEGIPDDILNWAIECEVSKKPFRIIRQELEFYRKHNIPIPRRHPDVRHMNRMKMRNPRKFYERICDCLNCEDNWKQVWRYDEKEFCIRDPESSSGWRKGKIMITTYSIEKPERVYCEVCYEREVVA